MSSTPSLPTVHLNIGGIAENTIVPRSVAAGEADCASDHGADRLGANSLLDLAVFGRQAAIATAELVKPNSPAEQLPKNAGEASIARGTSSVKAWAQALQQIAAAFCK